MLYILLSLFYTFCLLVKPRQEMYAQVGKHNNDSIDNNNSSSSIILRQLKTLVTLCLPQFDIHKSRNKVLEEKNCRRGDEIWYIEEI